MANNGKQGEQLFKQIMESRNYQVEDVSSNSDYWRQDIDFLVTSPTSSLTKSFEVKWDSKINRTGNLYLEFVNKNSEGCCGWFEFCQADYLAYGNAIAKKFFIIPMQELKERVKHLPQRVAFCGDESAGYLIHISQIEDIIQVLA